MIRSIFLLLISLFSSFNSIACDTTKIIAHRGVSSLAPENTIPAFEIGIQLNVDYIELDVQKSSDDSLMVIHDATVNGTTESSGQVSSYTYAELKQMDAGSWFSDEYIGTEIPTLHEVLQLVQGKAKLCVELKASNIEDQAMDLIEGMNMIDDVVIFSFDLSQLDEVKNINPNVKVCYLSPFMTSGDISQALSINAEYLGVGLDPGMDNILAAQAAGLEVWNYTINDSRDMLNKMSKGINGIITDNAQDLIGLKTYMRNGGLVSEWSFDEGTGSSSTDASYNGNNLNVNNATWTSGVALSGLYFNGVSSYVTVPPTPSLNIDLDAVSISVWLKLEELPSQMSDSYGPIYDSDDDYYVMYLDKGSEELRFKVKDGYGLFSRPGIDEDDLVLNEWIHVVGVYNGKEAMIYLNGVLMDHHATTGIGDLGLNQSAQLGRDGGNYFKGSIDEFKIYERPLSRQEVVDLYEFNTSICDFNESFEYAITELTGTYSDIAACPPISIEMAYELPRNVYDFDEMDYINVESVIDDLQYDSHSFFSWIKTSSTNGSQRIFAINDRYGGNRFLFGINEGNLDIYVPGDYLTGNTLVSDNQWHYIGYTYDVLSEQVIFYVDGVVDAVFNEDLTILSTDRASLGQEFDGFQCSNFYLGKLSDISIWSDVLSSGEINTHLVSPNQITSTSNLVALYKEPNQCSYSLQDVSGNNNHGLMCKPIVSTLEYIDGVSSDDYTETWSDENGEVLATGNDFNEIINATTSIFYEAQNGSIFILDTIEIEVYPLPDLDLGNDTLICSGENLVLDAGVQSSYLWSDNSTAQTLEPDFSSVGSFTFSVSVENQFGCSSEDDVNIEVQDCAELSILNNSDDIIFYPNPFRDVVYSNVNLEDYEIEVFDNQGRKLYPERIDHNLIELKGSSGFLLLVIKHIDKTIYKRITRY